MTECRNTDLQDLLPDYVSGSMGDTDRGRLLAHLAACEACTADLDLLRRIRAARPRSTPVDVSRIVSALPAPPVAGSARPALQLHRSDSTRVSARPSLAPVPQRRLFQGPSLWRLAAAIGVVLTGGMSVLVARHGLVGDGTTTPAVAQTGDSAAANRAPISSPVVVAERPAVRAETTVAAASSRRPSSAQADVPLSYGGLDDVTDDELQRLLDRLEQWDGATNAEPLPTVSPVRVTLRGGTLP